MFTIKLYKDQGFRQLILEAESFTILRPQLGGGAEITLHRARGADGESYDVRYDIEDGRSSGSSLPGPTLSDESYAPEKFERAIIENAAGKTTEIIAFGGIPMRNVA